MLLVVGEGDLLKLSLFRGGPVLVLPFHQWFCLLVVGFINEPPHDKTNKVAVRPAKTQISLGIRPV